jgi:diadenosine tetraphosphate (Ap4A) HIT family hydrolase
LQWGPSLDQTSGFQEVAKNIFFLGSQGIRELHGLRVAFMSGHFPLQAMGALETMQAKALTGLHDANNPVDILLTAQWPSAVCSMLQGAAPPDVRGQPLRQVGTSAASSVAKVLCPRYHFAGSERTFYERPPYMNPPPNNTPGAVRHITRFFGLAHVGNPDKKNRWLYAAGITAVRDMTPDALNQQPPNTTPSPYAPPPPAKPTGFIQGAGLGTGSNAGAGGAPPPGFSATICHVANLPYSMTDDSMAFAFAQFGEVARVHLARDKDTKKLRGFGFVEFKVTESARKAVAASGFDVGGRQVRVSFAPEKDTGKRGPGGPDGATGEPRAKRQAPRHPLMLRSDNCWFCLSSPKVEKHLVVSIGEEVYVALAKGPLVPEHVLILPITHYPAGSQLPDEVWAEVELYKKSLAECFRKELKSGLVLYERATNVTSPHSHCHFQAIPVPADAEEAGASRACGVLGGGGGVLLCIICVRAAASRVSHAMCAGGAHAWPTCKK